MRWSGGLAWSIEFDPAAFAELNRLDHPTRSFALPLRGEQVGLWRYRVGAYRVVFAIEEKQARVRVLRIGHRRDVYDRR